MNVKGIFKKRKVIGVVILAVVAVLVVAAITLIPPKSKLDMGEIYTIALDSTMTADDGLNSGMEYIAIDMSRMEGLKAGDRQQILDHFKKYNVEVLEATYEQLKANPQRMNKDGDSLKGILLAVQSTSSTLGTYTIECSKFVSGKGAIGGEVKVRYVAGKWVTSGLESMWIS